MTQKNEAVRILPERQKFSARIICPASIAGNGALQARSSTTFHGGTLVQVLHQRVYGCCESSRMISALQNSPLPFISVTSINTASTSGEPVEAFSPAAPGAQSQPVPGSSSQSGPLSPGTLNQLIQVQSQQPASSGADGAVDALIALGAKGAASGQIGLGDSYKSALFNVASGDSGSDLTRSELQQSVIAGGGTAQEADALYDQIDPKGTGSVNETQMAGQLATPTSGDTFGDALSSYLKASGDSQQTLIQQLMGIGLTQDQANSLAQQMQSTGLT